MTFHILTLFPEMFTGPFGFSIIKRACDQNLTSVTLHQLRDYAIDKRGTVDGRVYGGGCGMILRCEPVYAALADIKKNLKGNVTTILLTPKGNTLSQAKIRKLAKVDNLILICGHYEGYDERITSYVDGQVSIGNYILTGGEIPAMVLVDAIARLQPGVLSSEATTNESFTSSCHDLEAPQFTTPRDFKGQKVPEILLSGNHGEIKKWREGVNHHSKGFGLPKTPVSTTEE